MSLALPVSDPVLCDRHIYVYIVSDNEWIADGRSLEERAFHHRMAGRDRRVSGTYGRNQT